MSVILDALHKARGDRRDKQSEPHANTVARVLDAGAAMPPAVIAAEKASLRGRGWIAVVAVIFGTLCLIALIGGAFFLLYDQMRRIEARSAQGAVAAIPAANATTVAPVPEVAQAPLPTPLPLSELPIQPPAAVAGSVSAASVAAAPAQPHFTLGSIVCEGTDCLASLNGRSMRVGEVIKGYKVMAIDPSTITIKSVSGNDEITLSLYD